MARRTTGGILEIGSLSEENRQKLNPFNIAAIKPLNADIDYPGRLRWEAE